MSQYNNNITLHNIRMGVRMVQEGMPPKVASFAMAEQGINAPAEVLAGLATPGVMESLGRKPFTHKRTDQHIAAHKNMMNSLGADLVESELEENYIRVNFIYDEE